MESPYNNKEKIASELLWYAKSKKVFLQLHKKMNEILLISLKSYIINVGVPISNSVKEYLESNKYIKRKLF
jgi:folate-binding Fe-S cluster repair protein YgfZ